jgi:sensor histidine kinase YesM
VEGRANGNDPPLLLIQFVENAFKHGMKENRQELDESEFGY